MTFQIVPEGPFAALKVNFDQSEAVKAKSGAMVSMSETVEVSSMLHGGFWKALFRKFLARESLFYQKLQAVSGKGDAILAPKDLGEIMRLDLTDSSSYLIQKRGFLAATEEVELSTKAQNLSKGLFSGEGFFVLHAEGAGTLFVSGRGAIRRLDLAEGETRIIDNSHLVAWNGAIDYRIERASRKWFSTVTSGEGLVCRFHGPGDVYIQTRQPKSSGGSWLTALIPN